MKDEMYTEMNFAENTHWWFCAKRKIVFTLLKRYVGNDIESIADFGCGTGATLSELKLAFSPKQLYGFDFSDSAIAFCKKKTDCILAQADLNKPLDFAQKCDAAIALDVLEHIDNDDIAIKNIYNSLKKDGICIITVPAFEFLWSKHDENCMHKRRYNKAQMVKLAENCGFNIQLISYLNCFLFIPAYLIRQLSKFLGFDKNSTIESKIPIKPINSLLKAIFSVEAKFLKKNICFPFGLSLICVLKKTDSEKKSNV